MQLTFRLKKAPEYIFDCLSDMQKFVQVHPIISKIEETGPDNYLVYETLQLAWIPISFTYPVTVKQDAHRKEVEIRATVMKFTKIELKFVLKAEQDHTVVVEHIRIRSPFPVKYLMQRIFRKQHGLLFKNMESGQALLP